MANFLNYSDDDLDRLWNSYDKKPVEQNSGRMGDVLTDLKIGGAGLLQSAAGLGDLVAQTWRDEDDETFSEALAKADADTPGSQAWMQAKQREYSPARQEAEADYRRWVDSADSEVGKFGGTVAGLAMNPSVAIGRFIQSVPAIVASAAPGGAVGRALGALGKASGTIATGARIGAAAGEGAISAGNAAHDIIGYNAATGRDKYEGVGHAATVGLGVGAISMLGNKIGGGIEAGLFNKEAREPLRGTARQTFVKDSPRSHIEVTLGSGRTGQALRAGIGEGVEEAGQSFAETVPTNLAMDKEWSEDLGQNIGEGMVAGAGMGATVGGLRVSPRDKSDLLGNANKPETPPQAPENAQPGTPEAPVQPEAPQTPTQPETPVTPTDAQAQAQQVVGDAVATTNPIGAQQAQPTAPTQPAEPQLSAQEQKALARKQAQEQKEAEKAALEAQKVQEENDLRAFYLGKPEGTSIPKAVANRHKSMQQHPVQAPVLGAFARANRIVGARRNPAQLQELTADFAATGSVEAAAKRMQDTAGQYSKDPSDVDLRSVAAQILQNPTITDEELSRFQQNRIDERARANLEAQLQEKREADAKQAKAAQEVAARKTAQAQKAEAAKADEAKRSQAITEAQKNFTDTIAKSDKSLEFAKADVGAVTRKGGAFHKNSLKKIVSLAKTEDDVKRLYNDYSNVVDAAEKALHTRNPKNEAKVARASLDDALSQFHEKQQQEAAKAERATKAKEKPTPVESTKQKTEREAREKFDSDSKPLLEKLGTLGVYNAKKDGAVTADELYGKDSPLITKLLKKVESVEDDAEAKSAYEAVEALLESANGVKMTNPNSKAKTTLKKTWDDIEAKRTKKKGTASGNTGASHTGRPKTKMDEDAISDWRSSVLAETGKLIKANIKNSTGKDLTSEFMSDLAKKALTEGSPIWKLAEQIAKQSQATRKKALVGFTKKYQLTLQRTSNKFTSAKIVENDPIYNFLKEVVKTGELEVPKSESRPLAATVPVGQATATWYSSMTDNDVDQLKNANHTAAGKKILEEVAYVKSDSVEGLGVPLRHVAENSNGIANDLKTIFPERFAQAVADTIDGFRKRGIPIPDVYVIDLSRQIAPSAEALDMAKSGAGTNFGYSNTSDATIKNAVTGQVSNTRIVFAAVTLTKENGAVEHLWNKEVLSHEVFHAMEAVVNSKRQGDKPLSELFTDSLMQSDVELSALQKVSRALSDKETNINVKRDPTGFLALAKKVLAGLTQDEAVALYWKFYYPLHASEEGTGNYVKELFAELGAVYVADGETFAVVKKYFPALAKAIDDFMQGNKQTFTLGEKNDNLVPTGRNSPARATYDGRGVHSANSQNDGAAKSEESGAKQGSSAKPDPREKLYQDLKRSEESLRAEGIDPKVQDSKEWKALADAAVDAEVAYRSALGKKNNASKRLKNSKITQAEYDKIEQDYFDKKDARDAAREKLYEYVASQAKSNYTPPKKDAPGVANQYPFDRWVNKIPKGKLQDTVRNLAINAYKTTLGFTFLRDLVAMVKDYLPSAQEWFHEAQLAHETANVHRESAIAIGAIFNKLDAKGQKLVNQFLDKATVDKVWGKIPDHVKNPTKDEREANAKFAKELEQLSPEARKVFDSVLDFGTKTLRTIRDLTVKNIRAKYATRMEKATPTERQALQQECEAEVKRAEQALQDPRYPYVPLRRFGSHVVSWMSDDYAILYSNYLAQRNLASDNPADRRALEAMRTKLLAMQRNGKDYIVEFAESASAALNRAQQITEEMGKAAEWSERREWMANERINGISKLMEIAERATQMSESDAASVTLETVDAKANRMFSDMANMLYIQSLADDSALKHRLHRRDVSGYSTDMMRGFLETAKQEAFYIGMLEHGDGIRHAMTKMVEEARHSDKKAVATTVLNEMIRRIELDAQTASPFANAAMRTTSIWMLLTSPAFYFQSLTQPIMLSAPFMASRFGFYQPMRDISSAMLKVAQWVKEDGTLSDLDKLVNSEELTKEEREVLKYLRERGLLDIGLSQEFGALATRKTADNWVQSSTNVIANFTDVLAGGARKVELINRVSTALVAYRLEKARLTAKEKGMTEAQIHEAAKHYADNVIYETHGDYSAFNAPRYFKANTMLRLATQFRKFQLIQIGLFWRMVASGFVKKDVDHDTKKFARLGLGYTLAIHGVMCGALGMPLVAQVAQALGMILGDTGDDEEDYWRKAIGDKDAADFLLKGLPAYFGLDLSKKIGAGDMLRPFAFNEFSWFGKNGEDDAYHFIAALAGPAASVLVKGARGASYMWEGDYAKGAEGLAPNGIANAIKAIRFANDGMTTKAGDLVIPGEKFDFIDIIMQALGQPTRIVTDRNYLVGALYRHEQAFQKEATKIRKDYRYAVRNHDAAGIRKAQQDWLDLSGRRWQQGFSRLKLDQLRQSAKAQRTREKNVVGGVPTTKANRGFVRKVESGYQM